jgi:hypothetical protein
LLNEHHSDLTSEDIDQLIKYESTWVRRNLVRSCVELNAAQIDTLLQDQDYIVRELLLRNERYPVSKAQYDRLFNDAAMINGGSAAIWAAIMRKDCRLTKEQIGILTYRDAIVLAALDAKDGVRFTRKQVVDGLLRVSDIRVIFAFSMNYKIDHGIVDIALEDKNEDVRLGFAWREDYKPTKTQFIKLLNDDKDKVRIITLKRSDLILDEDMAACRKHNISENEESAWRQAIARSSLAMADVMTSADEVSASKSVRRI